METSDPNWASNTTLDVQSDFYVANRGDNTIVRMRQDGSVVSQRHLRIGGRPLDALRLNGIATSPDGTKIWVTLNGPLSWASNMTGAVAEFPAF
jgi:DNA-binding beta-propeller fold protein YncE